MGVLDLVVIVEGEGAVWGWFCGVPFLSVTLPQ